LSTRTEDALRLKRGWRSDEYAFMRWGSFMSRVMNDNSDDVLCELHGPLHEDDEHEILEYRTFLTNDLATLEREAGGAPGTLLEWLLCSQWLDVAVPSRILFLEDMNCFIGYQPEWTKDPARALTFSKAEIDGGDPEVDLIFKHLGRFVPL